MKHVTVASSAGVSLCPSAETRCLMVSKPYSNKRGTTDWRRGRSLPLTCPLFCLCFQRAIQVLLLYCWECGHLREEKRKCANKRTPYVRQKRELDMSFSARVWNITMRQNGTVISLISVKWLTVPNHCVTDINHGHWQACFSKLDVSELAFSFLLLQQKCTWTNVHAQSQLTFCLPELFVNCKRSRTQ